MRSDARKKLAGQVAPESHPVDHAELAALVEKGAEALFRHFHRGADR